jgi:hypothetical protein
MRHRNSKILEFPPGTGRFGMTVRRIRLMIAPLIQAQASDGGTRRQKIAAWRTAWHLTPCASGHPVSWRRSRASVALMRHPLRSSSRHRCLHVSIEALVTVPTRSAPRRPQRLPRPRPRARNLGQAAEQASGKTPAPGITTQNSSCTNQSGNGLRNWSVDRGLGRNLRDDPRSSPVAWPDRQTRRRNSDHKPDRSRCEP